MAGSIEGSSHEAKTLFTGFQLDKYRQREIIWESWKYDMCEVN